LDGSDTKFKLSNGSSNSLASFSKDKISSFLRNELVLYGRYRMIAEQRTVLSETKKIE
jgi:hypothetical protein